MQKKPTITNLEVATKSRLFTIESMHLKFTNGTERNYERIASYTPGAVMIIPLLNPTTFLLIREYCAGVDDYVIGFPKGAIETGENLLDTANRELKEEVGYQAQELKQIARFSTAPGYMAAMMDIVLAKELSQCHAQGDEPEAIEVIPWQFDQIHQLLAHPQFHEARSIAALFLLLRHQHETANLA